MPYLDGCRGSIYYDTWHPEGEPRSVVVFLHGYAEHIGLYEPLFRRLADHGHAVYAFDEVGHGRSDGERAVIESWDILVEDAGRLIELTRRDVPLVLMGHSGGALGAFLVATRNPGLATAVILSAGPLLPIDWIDAELAGDVEESEDLDPTSMLSTHPDYVHALLHDPLVYQGGFAQETIAAVKATWPEVEAALENGALDIPVLMLHGEEDPVVPLSVGQEVAGRLAKATLRTFPGDLHDVLNEHDRDLVHEVVVDWL
jgi:acylglycerol lipase